MLVLYLVWGSTYLGIAIAVDTIPPFLMAAVRFGLAGLVLLAWSLARERGSFVWPTRREWRDSAIVGALLLGGGMGMVAFGEQTVPSGIAALIIAMMPVWVAIFGGLLLGERLPRSRSWASPSASSASPCSSGRRRSAVRARSIRSRLAAVLLSPICWSTGIGLRLAPGGPPARSADAHRGADARPVGSCSPCWPRERRVRRGST